MGIATPLRQELAVFLWCMVGGGAVGALYDVFRLVRLTRSFSVATVFFQDLLYWTGAAFLLFFVFLTANGGELRLYLFLSAFWGLVLYLLFLSKPIRSIAVFLLKILFFPLRIFLRLLKKPCFLVISVGKRTGYLFGRHLREWKKCRQKI